MINFEDLRTEIDEVKDLFNSTEAFILDNVLKLLSECNLLDAIKMLKVLKSMLKDVSLLDFVENWIYVLDMTKNRGFLNEFGIFKSFDELVKKGLIELSDDSSSIICCDVELLGYLYLPDYIKVIKQKAFTQCFITEVILNDNLEEIEGKAFYDCTFLKRIVIPSKIKKIPFQCFYKCCSLSEIVMNENCEECFDGAFYETKIKKIIHLIEDLIFFGIDIFIPDMKYLFLQ